MTYQLPHNSYNLISDQLNLHTVRYSTYLKGNNHSITLVGHIALNRENVLSLRFLSAPFVPPVEYRASLLVKHQSELLKLLPTQSFTSVAYCHFFNTRPLNLYLVYLRVCPIKESNSLGSSASTTSYTRYPKALSSSPWRLIPIHFPHLLIPRVSSISEPLPGYQYIKIGTSTVL